MDLQKVADVLGASYIFLAYLAFAFFVVCMAFRSLGSALYRLKNRFPNFWPNSGNPNDQHRQDFATAFLIGGAVAESIRAVLATYF